jgi:hypothetical protein
MTRVWTFVLFVGLFAGIVAVPSVARAQGDRASIAGLVSDQTGAVMPGVTVEASSPALIERTRSATTDAAGRYAIIDLRPGTYTVSFSLSGFRTVVREGVVLEGAFAAQINGTLTIGSVEETITVAGVSPIVDVQSTRNQFVANQAVLESLPVARTLNGGMSLVPGVNATNNAAGSSSGQILSDLYINTASVHGSVTADQHTYVDGMNVAQMLTGAGGQITANPPNDLTFAEVTYDVGTQSAEIPVGGIRSDVIPKEGGNKFAGTWRAFGSNQSLSASNLTPELAQFIKNPSVLDYNWENNVAFGGPIKENKLWFFGAYKLTQANILATDSYWPDGRRADTGGHVNPNATVRLTYQMTPKNKLRISANDGTIVTERFFVTNNYSPEANLWLTTPLNYSGIAKGTSVVTNRLMFEYGESIDATTYNYLYQQSVGPFDVQKLNGSTGKFTVAYSNPTRYFDHVFHTVGNVNYVTGTHAFKSGVSLESGYQRQSYTNNGDMSVLTYVNVNNVPTPSAVSVRNTSLTKFEDVNAILGLFAQDKWSMNRMTLTYGARYDYLNVSVPAQTNPAGRFVPARQSDPIACLPCWNDWAIRLGGAYDLFENGKTALKASVGKFVASQAAGIAASTNPMQLQTDSRGWTDLDNNGSALDANGNPQFAEIGQSRNSNFGVPKGATRFDPASPRPTNWEENVSVVRELIPNVSVTGAYYHRAFFNQTLVRNLLVDPVNDWVPYTITAPKDAKLPNGGGEVITLYNLKPEKLGVVDSVSSFSTTNTRVYDGIEFSANARIKGGGFVLGSITSDRTKVNNCDVANSDPNGLRFCNQVPPFRGLYKVSASYPVPFQVQLSGTFQLRPGNSIGSNYTFNSTIAGVALTGGGTRTVQLVDPTTLFYPYIRQLDLRAARNFHLGARRRLQAFVEIFNLPNVSTVLTVNEIFGAQWLQPQIIDQPRHFQIGAQFDF